MIKSTDHHPVNVALVGPGTIAEYHLHGLAATDRINLKAIVGRRLESAAKVARQFAAECASDDLDEVLAREDLDAVVIATPDDTHEAIAVRALTAGKAVLLQKPMATDSASCQRIIDAAERSGADLQVSFMHRYFEEVCAVRELIAQGALGTLTSARMRNATPGPDWGEWFFDRERVGSGVVAQLGIHGIDLLTHLLGPIAEVSARLETLVPTRHLADGRVVQVHNPDTALASYRFAAGPVASHEMSMVEVAGCDRFRLELYGTEGTAWLRSERGELAVANKDGEWTVPKLQAAAFGKRQHDRWIDGLLGMQPPEDTAREALAGMQVLETIQRSATAGSANMPVAQSTEQS